MSASNDAHWMALALDCARRGRGAVEPNPMVGAVIVRDGQELARGWHRRFGGAHAERDALAAAAAAGHDVRGATMYVTLEPCCHTGKTPPCTEAVLEAGLGRVVVAMEDPDPRVSGKGLDQLRRAGLTVDTDVCGESARELLAPYVKQRRTHRPWVIAKWAQTADGWLALPAGQGRWVSCQASRQAVHELRSWIDGIAVGIGTVRADDPLLTNRSGQGRQPVRVVLDTRARTPAGSQLIRTAGQVPVVIACAAPPADPPPAGVEYLPCPLGADGRLSPTGLLDALGPRGWTYLLVEGGPAVLGSFLAGGAVDEIMAYVSPRELGPAGGSARPPLPRMDVHPLLDDPDWRVVEDAPSGADRYLRLRRATLSRPGSV